MNKHSGFSLIELIVFIVVIGIAVAAIMVPLNMASEKSPNPNYQTIALQLAQGRMELLLGQRYLKGYVNFADPCSGGSPPAICTSLTGFTVTSVISTISTGREIAVTATGFGTIAVLTARIGDY